MNNKKGLAAGVCALLGVALCASALADPTTFSDQYKFTAALPTEPSILDFDQIPAGTTIRDAAIADGIKFTYDFDGLTMKVAHLYATTSSPNFLGTGDGGMFHDGDDFTLSFPSGSAIGLYFISADPLLDGDITVTAGGATASLVADHVQDTLSDGSRVYFLGIVDDQAGLSHARVEALAGGFFLYNVDDIITAPSNTASLARIDGQEAESY